MAALVPFLVLVADSFLFEPKRIERLVAAESPKLNYDVRHRTADGRNEYDFQITNSGGYIEPDASGLFVVEFTEEITSTKWDRFDTNTIKGSAPSPAKYEVTFRDMRRGAEFRFKIISGGILSSTPFLMVSNALFRGICRFPETYILSKCHEHEPTGNL